MSEQQHPTPGSTVGPVEVGDVIVLAEYCPAERWNGFLCPRIDALAAVAVLTHLAAQQPPSIAWTFGRCGALVVINLDYVTAAENVAECVEVYEPNADGLYALGAWGWTWSETVSAPVSATGEPQTPTSRLLDRYRRWSAGREALTVRENGSGTSVAAGEWESSDDQGVELAHRLADVLVRA